MNISPVNIFSGTNINYSKQPLNQNRASSAPAASYGIYNSSAHSLAFTALRKGETKRISSIYRRKPVNRKKLETINKTIDAYKETIPAARKAYNNFIDVYENSRNKALRAYNESSPKCDEEGNFHDAEGVDILSDSYSVKRAITYDVRNKRLNSYKEGFVNSSKPAPDGLRVMKKGVITKPDETVGEYFEGRKYNASILKKGADNSNTTEKSIIFDTETNTMLKYTEGAKGIETDGKSLYNAAKGVITFDMEGAPASYKESMEYHKRENYDSAKRVITFTKDSEGNTVPKYYYENWKCFNGQNRISYSYKAERLEDGSWIVVR